MLSNSGCNLRFDRVKTNKMSHEYGTKTNHSTRQNYGILKYEMTKDYAERSQQCLGVYF